MTAPIYLDHNATSPLHPEALQAMEACYRAPLLNPASQHAAGRAAHRSLEASRQRIAELLGARTAGMHADRVIFTSGGTEANNLALFGLVGGRHAEPGHVVISAIEHPSMTAPVAHLKSLGWQIDQLGVDSAGIVRTEELRSLLRPETRLVSVMLANNETGVLQPVAELAAICQEHRVPLHTDAVQMAGKLPIDFARLGVTAMTVAAHKLNGPLGIGALVVRSDANVAPDLYGSPHQEGLRPGTEPVALAAGMCRALEVWHERQAEYAERLATLRDELEAALVDGWPQAVVIGAGAPRLPHTANVSLVGLDRQALFMALDQRGIACSTGAACSSGSSEVSPVHSAMGCSDEVAQSAFRFSLGLATTPEEVAEAARRVLAACGQLAPQTA